MPEIDLSLDAEVFDGCETIAISRAIAPQRPLSRTSRRSYAARRAGGAAGPVSGEAATGTISGSAATR